MADDVDISGMPDPTPDWAGVSGAPDVSDMPAPAELFKQHVGREGNPTEVANFMADPSSWAGSKGSDYDKTRKGGAADFPIGVAETGANLATGTLAAVPAFIAHVATLVGSQDPDAAKAVRDAVQDTLTYQPRYSSTGQELSSAPGQIVAAALKAAKDTKAFQAVSDAATATFGPAVLESAKAGLGMAAEAVGAIPGAAALREGGQVLSRAAAPVIEGFKGGNVPPDTQYDHAGNPVTPQAPVDPTKVTPPTTDGPVSGADLRSQADPLAGAEPAPATTTPPEAPVAPAAPPRVPVPGKPHIRPKAVIPTPEAPAGVPEAATRFTPPSAEGATAGPAPAAQQAERAATLGRLNDLAGGQLDAVRTSALSGDTSEAGTDFQHSTINDAGGKRMNSVIAGETNALRAGADNLVTRAGSTESGVDQGALRQRGTTISKAISGIQDWFNKSIEDTYETAKARAKGTPIQDMTNLKSIANDESNFAGTTEGEALYRGVQSKARKLGLMGQDGVFKPSTIEQAEQFRQYLGEQWTPRTAKLIDKLKDATDEDVARHGGADLFQQARSLRSRRGTLLDDPTGIAKLLSPDDRLGINRAVPLEQVPDYVANLPTDQFNHVVNVLKSSAHLGGGELAEDAAAAIREIKGHMAARLQEAGGSKIQGGWSAKAFYDKLNQYSNKMPAVFSGKEMKDWKTVNDASNIMRMDRRYPGAAAQMHNTGVGAQLREKAGRGARAGVDVLAHHALPIVGPAIAETTGLTERVGKFVGGNPEVRRLAEVEKRITKLGEKPKGGGPTLGQRIGGGNQRGGPKASTPTRAGSNAQDRFMAELNSATKSHPTEPTQRRLGNASLEAVKEPYDANAVHIEHLRSDVQGSGHGAAALKKMTDMADRHGVALTLDPIALDKTGGIPQAKLEEFYKKHGFESAEPGMRREPVEQPLAAKFPGQRGGPAYDPYNRSPAPKKPEPRGKDSGNPYDNAPERKDPWGSERVKNDRLRPTSQNSPLGSRIFGGKQRGAVGNLNRKAPAPLEGAPQTDRPNPVARVAAAKYAKAAGIDHEPLSEYRYIPKETAAKVANAYEEMKHNPSDPKVKAAYDAFKSETKAQWEGIQKNTGLKVDFKQPYPYGANPREVTEDVRNNNHMTVFPTEAGFGEGAADTQHPMLEKSGVKIDGKEVTYNDLFRIVHDYYGHVQEGNGFRGQGEYNAWRNHRTLYSKAAQPAMDSETLGQNAWVNNGPKAAANVGASQTDTAYADQKAGLLPKDVVKEATQGVSRQEHEATAHLTDEERSQLRSDTTQKLMDSFHKDLPPHEEYAAAALAGKAKKGWYADSAKAITNVFGPDAPRFAALLASMSPQTSVQMNFHNALRTFINWDKAGRPQDAGAIKKIMEESSLNGGTPGRSNVLPAWVPNSVRSLTAEDPEKMALSGPKVHSFMRNLQDNVHEVTNDAWMAAFSKVDPAEIGGKGGVPGNKRPAYMAMSAKVRAAAKTLTQLTGESWTPREVQETVWSWAKTAYEHAESFGGMATIPELVKHGEITDDLIKSTPDFHQLFGADEHSGFIRHSRYAGNAEQLDSAKGKGANPAGSSEKSAAAQQALRSHLEAAARRLETVRQDRAKARATSDEE